MLKCTVDVIIPTYKPDGRFEKLIMELQHQTVKPMRIFVINTKESAWVLSSAIKKQFDAGKTVNGIALTVCHITEDSFDHGGTRAKAASRSEADVLLFMTQDAIPADQFLIEHLLEKFDGNDAGRVAAAYARQLPDEDCNLMESFTRSFNYGNENIVKSAGDLPKMGIKTFFCSNVCAAYDHKVYRKLGGFHDNMIFNEDMVYAAEAIRAGYQIVYAADAKVVHSHNYSGLQQLRRNFDLAVSQVQHPEIFDGIRSESEGMRLVRDTAVYLVKQKRVYLLPKLFWQSACKYLGYLLGRNYQKLPMRMVMLCTMNRRYWKNKLF